MKGLHHSESLKRKTMVMIVREQTARMCVQEIGRRKRKGNERNQNVLELVKTQTASLNQKDIAKKTKVSNQKQLMGGKNIEPKSGKKMQEKNNRK